MTCLGLAAPAVLFALGILAAPRPNDLDRALELKAIIQKESSQYSERELVKRDLLEQLDTINSDQNRVREKIDELQANHQEMTMARDNLTVEYKKQVETQAFERNRLIALARFVYQIKKDGFLRFVIAGENLSQLAGRVRILYRTFRSHAQLTRKLEERAERLRKSETQLASVQAELVRLLRELSDQERLLGDYLKRKRKMVAQVSRKQSQYQRLIYEYRQIASHLSQLFSEFESEKPEGMYRKLQKRSLPFPVPMGRFLKHFGKVVHEQFGTVVFHKGIEIAADHNTPVSAIFGGTVEYAGWLKGLGNVLIIRHTGGLYSLSAHLFRVVKEKGATVDLGETVGYVGDTGSAERASLYFEIRENGKAVDPMAYFAPESLERIL